MSTTCLIAQRQQLQFYGKVTNDPLSFYLNISDVLYSTDADSMCKVISDEADFEEYLEWINANPETLIFVFRKLFAHQTQTAFH